MNLPVWILDPLRRLLGIDAELRLMMARDEHLRQHIAYLADWLKNVDDALYNVGQLQLRQQKFMDGLGGVIVPTDLPDLPPGPTGTVATSADIEARATEIREQVAKMKREFPLALKELQQNGDDVLQPPKS